MACPSVWRENLVAFDTPRFYSLEHEQSTNDPLHKKPTRLGYAKGKCEMRARLGVVLVAAALCVVVSPVEAQFVTLGEKVPATSGCYKPSTYSDGVNLMLKVWSFNLASSDLRSLGIQPSEIPLAGWPQASAGKLAEVIAKDLSRLKDTGIITANSLPKESDGEIPVHFYAQINLEPTKLTSGQVTGYVAVVHLEELCSVWGEGKDVGMGIREVEVPGVLMLSTLDEMVRNIEGLIYDRIMEVVKARRQAGEGAPIKKHEVAPEKKP